MRSFMLGACYSLHTMMSPVIKQDSVGSGSSLWSKLQIPSRKGGFTTIICCWVQNHGMSLSECSLSHGGSWRCWLDCRQVGAAWRANLSALQKRGMRLKRARGEEELILRGIGLE